MHANRAVVAIIAGLATAATLVPAGSALAAGKETKGLKAQSNTLVNTGHATDSTNASPPKINKSAAPRSSSAGRNPHAGSVTALLTKDCYVYSDGTGDLCLWYLPGFSGSRGGVYYNDSNLWDNYFATPGWGQNQTMANNAESAYNYDYYYTSHQYTGVNYTGYHGYISPRNGGNFVWPFSNNVESVSWS